MKKSKIITINDRYNESLKILKDTYETVFNGKCNIESVKNLVEKIAVWYELRYPDYEVTRLLYTGQQENININKVMFNDNPYAKELTSGMGNEWNKWTSNVLSTLEWNEFYNKEVFIKSLPFSEAFYLYEPIYDNIVYVNPKTGSAHLHLHKDGTIAIAENISLWTRNTIKDDDIEGMHIKDAVKLIKDNGFKLPEDNELEKVINKVDKLLSQREEVLNCAMYRIIERGSTRIGPRRAFLFAKEFNLNIAIPMVYGIDYSDPGLRIFVNEYIKAGGDTDLECYVDYHFYKNDKICDITTIDHIIKTKGNNCGEFYTEEEKILHQRLVNILANERDNSGYKKIVEKLNKSLNEIIENFFPKTGIWCSECFARPKELALKNIACNLKDNDWIARFIIKKYYLDSLRKEYYLPMEYKDYIVEFLNKSERFKELRHEYELRIVKWQIEYMLNDGENWIVDPEFGGEFYIFSGNCDKAFRKGIVDTLTAIGIDKEVIEEGIEINRHLWFEKYTKLAFKNLYAGSNSEFPQPSDEHLEKWLKIRSYDYYIEHKESVDKYGGISPGIYIEPQEEIELREWLKEEHDKQKKLIEEYMKTIETNLVPICTGTDKPLKRTLSFFKKKDKKTDENS